MDYTMRAYLFLFLSILTLSLTVSADNKSYKSFSHLTKEESKATTIFIDHERFKRITPPQNDFIPLTGRVLTLFGKCQETSTMLVFSQDMDALLDRCRRSFEAGAADSYFLIGEHLMSAEWTAPDYHQAVEYLLKAANAGSREAKRKLITYYTHPLMPTRDSFRALTFAKELSTSGFLWDEFRYATLLSLDNNKEQALQGYRSLLKLANDGYQNAKAMAALALVLQGPLNSLEAARNLFDIPQDAYHIDLVHAKLVFLVVDNNLESARDTLEDCYVTSFLCSNIYFHFLQKGIGGNINISKANDILEYINDRRSISAKLFYAWVKATAKESTIYNPVLARQVLNKIPDYKRQLPHSMDTIAAIYAANGDFELATELQTQVVDMTRGKGLGDTFERMKSRLYSYKKNERWIDDGNAYSYIERFKELKNITHIDTEIAAL